MPKLIVYIVLTVLVLALLPPALIARARTRRSDARRVHIIWDLDNQTKFRAQHEDPLFADGRAMRPPVEGTVARGELDVDEHEQHGVVGEAWATTFPASIDLTLGFLRRGQDRFTIYCTPCHGQAGYGDGMVQQRAAELLDNPLISNGTQWSPVKSLHDLTVRDQPPGEIFNTVSNGKNTMPGYAAQIPLRDRWAIVAYVKALQRSQHARPGDVPADVRENLPVQNLLPVEEDGQ